MCVQDGFSPSLRSVPRRDHTTTKLDPCTTFETHVNSTFSKALANRTALFNVDVDVWRKRRAKCLKCVQRETVMPCNSKRVVDKRYSSFTSSIFLSISVFALTDSLFLRT